MASIAYTTRLETVLSDADEINRAHSKLRTGVAGRQYGLGALNRAVVVMCVSAWEAYVEEVTKECLVLLKPSAPPLGTWPALNASARSQIGRFNNPNVDNTQNLVRDCLGLDNITLAWRWPHNPPEKAKERLKEAIKLRHEIAHGVTPRPIIHNQQYAGRLPDFFRKLGEATDKALTEYLAKEMSVSTGW
ncbi:hypothetical protein Thimo_0203 [Thioflavicoccus mobilis 8321]|uniref:RiboL-PSP-HEPN domain-containing protein n=1 Tax=Thioflavicoccus mobilis 8321 TaxID=765912 RepID=L0GUN6_9GAMM|nr:HEPN domain-containing protein [Thioflavicoccus mobilis]AGA89075.1 hypothetical protein Thimo_0203 [Thioflavicoccus mobilis 8321]